MQEETAAPISGFQKRSWVTFRLSPSGPEMCDFHRNHVGRIERAERTITFEGVLRLSYALGVKPEELFRLLPIQKKLPPKKRPAKDE